MNNFFQRVLTGAALILVITSAAYCNRYTFVSLILLIDILSLSEFYRLACSGTRFGLLLAGYLLSVSLLLSTAIVSCNHQLYWVATINLPLVFGVFILSLYSKSPQPFQRMAMILMALICVTVPLCFFIALAFYPFSVEVYHAQLVLGYFMLLWVYDSFAYLAGKAFGAHTLFKRISPKKHGKEYWAPAWR